MAKPPKLAIHDPYYQMKDFFIDESMKRVIPKNPYNLLWVLENVFNNDTKYKGLKEYSLMAIRENQPLDYKKYPLEVKNAILDDKWVVKRIKELHRDHNVDIDSIAVKLVRIGSDYILKELLTMGLDPNYIDENGNNTLHNSVSRKKSKILNTYFDFHKTNRYMLNALGENVAFSCIRYKNWKFLEKILKVEPGVFLTLNKNNESIFDLLGQSPSGQELFKKIPITLKEKLSNLIEYMYENNFNLQVPTQGEEVSKFVSIFNQKVKLQNELSSNKSIQVRINKI